MTATVGRTGRRRRLRREAWGFAVGSVCFAAGAIPFYADWAGAVGVGLTFFVGSINFTLAAFIQQSHSRPRPPPTARTGGPRRSSSPEPCAST